MLNVNKTNCSLDILGTGVKGCQTVFNTLSSAWLLEAGTKLDIANDTLDQAKIDELVTNNKLVILRDIEDYPSEGGVVNYETLPSGIKKPLNVTPYEWVLTYSHGICFVKALATLSAKTWDVILWDVDGKGICYENSGFVSGFNCSLAGLESFTLKTSAASQKVLFRVQLSVRGTANFRTGLSSLEADGVDVIALDGINQTKLEVQSATASSVVVKVTGACANEPFEGLLTATDYKITLANGSTLAVSGVTYADGLYALATTGLSGDFTVELYDTLASNSVIVVDGVYYQSNKASGQV